MSLKDLILENETEVVEIKVRDKKEDVKVKALNIGNIAKLFKAHAEEMGELLEGKGDLIDSLMKKGPEFIASVIAEGIEEDLSPEMVMKLPFPVQCKIAEKIWDMSIIDGEYLGKLTARIVSGLSVAAQKVGTILPADSTGKTPSAKESKTSLPTDIKSKRSKSTH